MDFLCGCVEDYEKLPVSVRHMVFMKKAAERLLFPKKRGVNYEKNVAAYAKCLSI